MDLSIIVPVYNTESFLSRCLDSIVNQKTSFNFEVIIVNDGSTDDSSKIINEYLFKYKNIRLLEFRTNKSLAVARSVGIKNATGEYVLHVDSDDWILPNTIEKLLYTLRKNTVDVIVFNYLKHNGLNRVNKSFTIKKEFEEFNLNDKFKIQKLFMGACVNKIVKRTLLNDLVYGSRYMNSTEDLIYSFEVFLKSKKILIINDVFYVYFQNAKSITNTSNPDKYLQSQISTYEILQEITEKYKPSPNYSLAINTYLDKFLYVEIFNNQFSKIINNKTFYKLLASYKKYNFNNVAKVEKSYKSFTVSSKLAVKSVGFYKFSKLVARAILNKIK